MQATANIVSDVLLGGTISLDNTGQKDKAFFTKKKKTLLFSYPGLFGNLKITLAHRFCKLNLVLRKVEFNIPPK